MRFHDHHELIRSNLECKVHWKHSSHSRSLVFDGAILNLDVRVVPLVVVAVSDKSLSCILDVLVSVGFELSSLFLIHCLF